ncbi:hypothetical protein ACA910_017601 [Epithemia clementina (nom. ined.)]
MANWVVIILLLAIDARVSAKGRARHPAATTTDATTPSTFVYPAQVTSGCEGDGGSCQCGTSANGKSIFLDSFKKDYTDTVVQGCGGNFKLDGLSWGKQYFPNAGGKRELANPAAAAALAGGAQKGAEIAKLIAENLNVKFSVEESFDGWQGCCTVCATNLQNMGKLNSGWKCAQPVISFDPRGGMWLNGNKKNPDYQEPKAHPFKKMGLCGTGEILSEPGLMVKLPPQIYVHSFWGATLANPVSTCGKVDEFGKDGLLDPVYYPWFQQASQYCGCTARGPARGPVRNASSGLVGVSAVAMICSVLWARRRRVVTRELQEQMVPQGVVEVTPYVSA